MIPPKCGPGTVDDAWQRFVVDMGAPGLDRGKGGKYLILPPDYEGDLDPAVGGEFAEVDGEKYIVAKSTSYVNWLILRGFLVDGKPDAASAMFRNGLKIYPLKDKKNPPEMKFIGGSEVPFNTIHVNDFKFYEELHHIIDREPLSLIDLELRGLIASIGIQKGQPFEPDARTKELLTKAVAVGNATARAIFFRPNEGRLPLREQRLVCRVRRGQPRVVEGQRPGRPLPRRANPLLLYGNGQHPGDGQQDGGSRFAVRV